LWFGNALRIRAYVLASGVFVQSISNAGMRDRFGIAQLSGKPVEKPKRGKASVRESRKSDGSGRVCFPFVSPGIMTGGRETDSQGVAQWLMDGCYVFV